MDISSCEAGDEVAECLRGGGTLSRIERLLVVALGEIEPSGLSGLAGKSIVYRLGETHATGQALVLHAPWLPFDDRCFDCVVLYRVSSHAVDIQLLLGEVGRVLRSEGSVLMIGRQSDFAFAPLPKGGPAHLLAGWLREAGFANVDFPPHAGPQVVAVAHA